MTKYITSGKYKGHQVGEIINMNVGYMDYCLYNRYMDEEQNISGNDEEVIFSSEI